MASEAEASVQERSAELAPAEVSVLRALCRTINAENSELKYKILDGVSKDDFTSRITKAIFTAVTEMYREGDFVVAPELGGVLRREGVELPENFSVDELFQGAVPDAKNVDEWLGELTKRPSHIGSTTSPAASPEDLARTMPPVAGDEPPSLKAVKGAKARSPSASAPDAPGRDPSVTQALPVSETQKIACPSTSSGDSRRRSAATPSSKTKRAASKATVILPPSESEEWPRFLQELAARPVRRISTGFTAWDREVGGLAPGLVLVVDHDQDRRCDFLKQLTDQVAERSQVPCLYVSFELPKAALRLRTLSRLARVRAVDLEKGDLKRRGTLWANMERSSREAAPWLKRIFVMEGTLDLHIDVLHELARELVDVTPESGALLVLDTLERLGNSPNSLVAEIKALSESFGMCLVVGTTDRSLLTEPCVDSRVRVTGDGIEVRIETWETGGDGPVTGRLDYTSETHRFAERSDE